MKTGETPLHIAVFHRKKSVVEKLMKTDAIKDINKQTKDVRNQWSYALRFFYI